MNMLIYYGLVFIIALLSLALLQERGKRKDVEAVLQHTLELLDKQYKLTTKPKKKRKTRGGEK